MAVVVATVGVVGVVCVSLMAGWRRPQRRGGGSGAGSHAPEMKAKNQAVVLPTPALIRPKTCLSKNAAKSAGGTHHAASHGARVAPAAALEVALRHAPRVVGHVELDELALLRERKGDIRDRSQKDIGHVELDELAPLRERKGDIRDRSQEDAPLV